MSQQPGPMDDLEKEVSSSVMPAVLAYIMYTCTQSLEEVLFDTILLELESVIDVKSLLNLVKYRAPDYIQQADVEEVLGVGPTSSEQISRLVDKLRDREDGCYVFLDCLRQLHCNITKDSIPIRRHILWFVPSPEYAVSVVSCILHSPKLQVPCQPFFWKVLHEAGSHDSHGFFYQCCSLFQHVDTSVIIVFPETTGVKALNEAIEGACRKWSGPHLMVYNDFMRCEGHSLGTPILVTGSDELRRHVSMLESTHDSPWTLDELQELRKETILFREMLWLCYLLEKNNDEYECDWLCELPWQRTSCLTPEHHATLNSKLQHWEDKTLIRYIEDSRLWLKDESSLFGWAPLSQLKGAVVCATLRAPPTTTPPTSVAVHYLAIRDIHNNGVETFVTMATQYEVCSIVAMGVNDSGCGLTTHGIDKAAAQNSAKLSVDCILFHLNN